jgi:hypothetical protein
MLPLRHKEEHFVKYQDIPLARRSSRRHWKLSGFSGELIKHSMMFANTSMILPRMCEPLGPLIPRKSAKEN